MTVSLEDATGERAPADDEYFLVVLLQLLDQREKIAVAAHDDVRVDVRVGEGHFKSVEGEVDVRAVLVAARRQVALDEADGVLGERPAVLARPGPVGVGDLGDHLAAFFEGFENDADIEVLAERGLDADLNVVEVDEYRDVVSFLGQNTSLRKG